MKHKVLVSLCLLGRVRGERTGLKVTVRREPTAGLSLYACSSPSLISFSLGHFGKDFNKLPTHPTRGNGASDFQSRSVRSLELRGGGRRGGHFAEGLSRKSACFRFFSFSSKNLHSTVVFGQSQVFQAKGNKQGTCESLPCCMSEGGTLGLKGNVRPP